MLKDILQKDRKDTQDSIGNDDYDQLKTVLSNEFCTNNK